MRRNASPLGPYSDRAIGWTFPCLGFSTCEAGSAEYVTKNFPVAVTDVATAFPKALRCATAKQKDIWFTEVFPHPDCVEVFRGAGWQQIQPLRLEDTC